MLFLVNKLLVRPACDRSVELTKKAEKAATVPKVLCDGQARKDMAERNVSEPITRTYDQVER